MVGILLVGLLIACYSCIEIGKKPSGTQGVIIHAFENSVYVCKANLLDSSYKYLKVTGMLQARHITVTNTAKVMGDAVINDSSIQELTVLGKAKLINLDMTGDLKIIGKAVLDNGNYNDISLQGRKFTLNNVNAYGLNFKGDDASNKQNKKQKLILTDCKINGDVVGQDAQNSELILVGKTIITGKIIGFKGC
jgi:hypothetical protein